MNPGAQMYQNTRRPPSSSPPPRFLFFIFITLLDFVLTFSSRLFDADHVISPVHTLCPALKKRNPRNKKRIQRRHPRSVFTLKYLYINIYHFSCSCNRKVYHSSLFTLKRRKKILEFFRIFTKPTIIYDVNVSSLMFTSFVRCCAGVVFCTDTENICDLVCLVFFVIVVPVFVHLLSFFGTVVYEFNYRV